MRLKSGIWVAAYLRRCNVEGAFAAVRRRGAEEAGAVFIKISRLDVASGRKEPWQTLKVPEPGAEFIGALALSADGKACAFTFQHDLANLYLVRGLK